MCSHENTLPSDVTIMTEITVTSSTTSGQRAIMTAAIRPTGSESCTCSAYLDVFQTEKLSVYHGYGIFIGLAIVSFVIARGTLAIRRRIYKDTSVMDTTFDAGGKVSAGIVSTYIVSQWIWADGLLSSTSSTTKYGVSGAFWYAAGTTTQMFLFAILIYRLKICSPGAKTFLQVIRARFGKTTHLTFCSFAILTNVIVTSLLMLGGSAAMANLIDDFSIVLATLLFTATISVYTLMGGLSAAFYVSYFNTGAIMVMMMVFYVKVFFDGGSSGTDNPLGSIDVVFRLVNVTRGRDNNNDEVISYLTMLSYPALIFGIINLVGNYGAVFVAQSFWQCGVAAKPVQGVLGFLGGGLTWFSIPFVFGTTMGLAYLALGEMRGSPLLSDDQVSQGLAAPVVSRIMLGQNGAAMVTTMVLMAVTSTGSAEVMAVTSIIVYDIYQVYLKPYRLVLDASTCVLCGRERGRLVTARDKCTCISMTYCHACKSDDDIVQNWKRAIKPEYGCATHGAFRKYNDYLNRLTNWCQVVVILSILPLTLLLQAIGIGPGWLYLFMGVLIGSAVIPISLCLFWTKLTGSAMTAGAIGGAVLGLVSWLIVSAYQPGGLANFFDSTGSDFSMLTGNVVSILSSGIISVFVTLLQGQIRRYAFTGQVYDSQQSNSDVWEQTRDIDNPLRPWSEFYTRELNLSRFAVLNQRPSLDEMANRFRIAKIIAVGGSISLTFGILFAWPTITASAGIMDKTTFSRWIHLMAFYGFTATVFILVMPIATEVYEIRRHMIERMAVEAAVPAAGEGVRQFPQQGIKQAEVERSAIADGTAVTECQQKTIVAHGKRDPSTVHQIRPYRVES